MSFCLIVRRAASSTATTTTTAAAAAAANGISTAATVVTASRVGVPLCRRLIYFDLETTGLNRCFDNIIEIGGLTSIQHQHHHQLHHVSNEDMKQKLIKFSSLVWTPKVINDRITDITGITREMVDTGYNFIDAWNKFEMSVNLSRSHDANNINEKDNRDIALIAHNGHSFDFPLMFSQLARYHSVEDLRAKFERIRFIDTLHIVQRLKKFALSVDISTIDESTHASERKKLIHGYEVLAQMPNAKLVTMRKAFRIDDILPSVGEDHRADVDCHVMKLCLDHTPFHENFWEKSTKSFEESFSNWQRIFLRQLSDIAYNQPSLQKSDRRALRQWARAGHVPEEYQNIIPWEES